MNFQRKLISDMQALHIISETNFVYMLTNKSWKGLSIQKKNYLVTHRKIHELTRR